MEQLLNLQSIEWFLIESQENKTNGSPLMLYPLMADQIESLLTSYC